MLSLTSRAGKRAVVTGDRLQTACDRGRRYFISGVGVSVAMNDVLGFDVIVPKHPQYIRVMGGWCTAFLHLSGKFFM